MDGSIDRRRRAKIHPPTNAHQAGRQGRQDASLRFAWRAEKERSKTTRDKSFLMAGGFAASLQACATLVERRELLLNKQTIIKSSLD
jgi:hypothetical protein